MIFRMHVSSLLWMKNAMESGCLCPINVSQALFSKIPEEHLSHNRLRYFFSALLRVPNFFSNWYLPRNYFCLLLDFKLCRTMQYVRVNLSLHRWESGFTPLDPPLCTPESDTLHPPDPPPFIRTLSP
jgi:hypothetical protein